MERHRRKESLEEEIGRVLLYEELHKGIAQLTQTQQRRLALYYFHGLTYEQIAAAEGVRSEGCTSRSAVQQALIETSKCPKTLETQRFPGFFFFDSAVSF